MAGGSCSKKKPKSNCLNAWQPVYVQGLNVARFLRQKHRTGETGQPDETETGCPATFHEEPVCS